ncbi:MAG: lyase [Bacilli bacterium]|nr:lyase [Bacilli bacterium]
MHDLVDHWHSYRVQVTNNTVIDSTRSITIARSHQYAPVDTIIANNIVKSSFGPLYNEHMQTNTVFEGNIGFGATLDNVPRTSAEIQTVDPLFTTVNGLQKLTASSPAIN